MPNIRLLARMNVAGEHHEHGDIVAVPAEVASNLVTLNRAVLVRGEQPETPEGRTTQPETAAAHQARPTRRRGDDGVSLSP